MTHHLNGADSALTADRLAASKLTRRSFLGLCLAGYAHVVRAGGAVPRDSTWALVSDTHISHSLDRSPRGSCMAENLHRVVDEIVAISPDHVLFNGDVGYARGRTDDYQAFGELVGPLAERRIPLHLTLGNHDHRGRLQQSFGLHGDLALADKAPAVLADGSARWLLLDSLERTNGLRGEIGDAQRDWLVRQIEADSSPVIVCMHHHPDSRWTGLKDADEFQEIVIARRQVKLVLFGHTHEYRAWQSEGLHFVNLPATGYALKSGKSLGWVTARPGASGIRLQFRGLTRHEPEHGATIDLPWRTDRT